eukprot:CAMPEP_0172668782 /NCGR_PEP_ID=MMETSP1074-20121228/9273_1 /TAXON_ID=2916 /ORGANISM="Ceratium fusus, Strain PA161109" /LENGTH=181 /DNA_ID=CAMNT_0013485469 /DNA_START=56 /DNA_END=598 /DNA_ORIENTATION=+
MYATNIVGGKRRVADPQGPVLDLLGKFGVRDSGGFYERHVRGKMLALDNSASHRQPGKKKAASLPQRHKEVQKKQQWTGLCYDDFDRLRDLWKSYVSDLMRSQSGDVAQALLSIDLHGSTLTVVQSKNPGCVNLQGTVIEETENTFRIITYGNRVRVLPKASCVFEVEAQGRRVRLLGPAW